MHLVCDVSGFDRHFVSATALGRRCVIPKNHSRASVGLQSGRKSSALCSGKIPLS